MHVKCMSDACRTDAPQLKSYVLPDDENGMLDESKQLMQRAIEASVGLLELWKQSQSAFAHIHDSNNQVVNRMVEKYSKHVADDGGDPAAKRAKAE